MNIIRTRTLDPLDATCYVVCSGGLFLNSVDNFAGVDSAKLFTVADAHAAMRQTYQSMVHYSLLSVVHLPNSPYREQFYA